MNTTLRRSHSRIDVPMTLPWTEHAAVARRTTFFLKL